MKKMLLRAGQWRKSHGGKIYKFHLHLSLSHFKNVTSIKPIGKNIAFFICVKGTDLMEVTASMSLGRHGLVSVFYFSEMRSPCIPSWPRTHFVDLAGLTLRDPPAPALLGLGSKVCDTTPGIFSVLKIVADFACYF